MSISTRASPSLRSVLNPLPLPCCSVSAPCLSYFLFFSFWLMIPCLSFLTCRPSGIPTSMFTVVFAVGRTAGWIAHWKESLEDPVRRISRPRQLYNGTPQRSYETSRGRRNSAGTQSGFTQLAEERGGILQRSDSSAMLTRMGTSAPDVSTGVTEVSSPRGAST